MEDDQKKIAAETKRVLDEINTTLAEYARLGTSSLNASQVAFVRARRSYLSPDQREVFSSILEEPKKEQATEKKA